MAGSIYTSLFGSGNAASGAQFTNASLSGTLTMGNNAIIAASTDNGGLRVGSAVNQKMGLWNVTPIVQPSGVGELIGLLGKADNAANATNMNSNGNYGTKAYTFNDVVKALKQSGALTSS